jgi:GDSL-like Lipase/Acylhydrolase family
MRERALRSLQYVTLSVASVVLVCLAVEGAARALVWSWERQPDLRRNPALRHDARLGWAKPPGRTWIRRPEYHHAVTINERGLRGPDYGYEKPSGMRRILLLGDSFTHGYSVADDETVSAVLERRLNAETPTKGWQVLNAGTAGYGTGQEYLFFLDEGRRYQPDEVVVMFYYNDILGDAPRPDMESPYFILQSGELALRNCPVPPPPADGERPSFRLKPFRRSMALRLLSDRTSTGNPELHRLLSKMGLVEVRGWEELPEEMRVFGPEWGLNGPRWEVLEALLRALDRAVRDSGGRLRVFYVPARFEISEQAWSLTRQRYKLGRAFDRDRVIEGLRDVCRALGLQLIDSRALFRASHSSGSPPYYSQDGHWNAEGHRLAAAALAGALAR